MCLNFIIRCVIAIYQGWFEFCQKGCFIGSQYLVKPNYNSCERRLWQGIFIVCFAFGCILLLYYVITYSENVFRIVIEDHGRDEKFNYPAIGICEMGKWNDTRVEEVLKDTIYQEFPNLSFYGRVRDFVHVMTFQNLNNKKNTIRKFLNYTNTLTPDLRDVLQNYDYKFLAKKISSNCEELFGECKWLNTKDFICCDVFRAVSTMLGTCFIFNSELSSTTEAAEMVNKIEIFQEPFRLMVTLKKPARIFLLNPRDVPEIITPLPKYKIFQKGVTLSMEFHVVPTVNDEGLLYLNPRRVGCIMDNNFVMKDKTYPHHSYSTCITNALNDEQIKRCNCTNLYAPETKAKSCNLSQYACLEKNNFINSESMLLESFSSCYWNCFDSEYIVENVYYSKSEDEYKDVLTLDFVLLNFPTKHRRRQAIRQVEDKMASLSGILGLFMGLSFMNILECIYLTCVAFFKYKKSNLLEVATPSPNRPKCAGTQAAGRRVVRGSSRPIVFQP